MGKRFIVGVKFGMLVKSFIDNRVEYTYNEYEAMHMDEESAIKLRNNLNKNKNLHLAYWRV